MHIKANAKLNLRLKIIGKLTNGYHLLEMINVPVTIFDEIQVSYEELPVLVQFFDPPLDCADDKTTIFKAYNLLSSWVGRPFSLNVKIKKIIPSGSGMGGGSSDAAAIIKVVSKKYDLKIDESRMEEIANKVGADVPFFLYNRPAFVEGIGEKITVYHKFPHLYFVVVVPDFSISTKWAYSQVNLPLTNKNINSNLKSSEMCLDRLMEAIENDLERIAEKAYPKINEIKSFLLKTGAQVAIMTGSGSAVVGLFVKESHMARSFEKCKDAFLNYKVFSCTTIGA